jgi:hypothetical protein
MTPTSKVSNADGVSCPAGHYLGATLNLVTGRPLYCSRCRRWYEWTDLFVGDRPKKDGEKV